MADTRFGCHRAVTRFQHDRTVEDTGVLRAMTALAQPHRLRIFRRLVVAGPAGMTPGAMATHLGIAAATLSFHLKELMHAELATQVRDGRHLIYRASFDRIHALIGYLTANCCQGERCSVETPVGACPAMAH
jgi:ArsR family transcriptional regulator